METDSNTTQITKSKNSEDYHNNSLSSLLLPPSQKIKVFVSSKCGDKDKYDSIRKELKREIENTNFATVYLFEDEEASTLPAVGHYIWALEESDVCIFLIDNKDGISPGVQKEIDTAKRCNIKSLYYFCDENEKTKTPLEDTITGAPYAKSKTVHSFKELSTKSAKALIDDIFLIYIRYCKGYLQPEKTETTTFSPMTKIEENDKHRISVMPEEIIKNIDKCKYYLLDLILKRSSNYFDENNLKTGSVDEWGVEFLDILFKGKSIKQFNTNMFLDSIKQQQDIKQHNITTLRWKAIQQYFSGNVFECVNFLEKALKFAKDENVSSWVIQDILIDLRNNQNKLNNINAINTESSAQIELNNLKESVYFPVLDRINKELSEKCIHDLYEEKIKSPYTVTFGNNCEEYASLLASSLVISLYYGSLTHILIFYNQIEDFMFQLCSRFNNVNFRVDLLKLAIFNLDKKTIRGIKNSFPEILNRLTSKDAAMIMDFCDNHPLEYQRLSCQLLALKEVGYYLEDDEFKKHENKVLDYINLHFGENRFDSMVGYYIFPCLTAIHLRMSQETLAKICCLFIDKNYSSYYSEMFNFIANCININKMTNSSATSFIQHIIHLFDSKRCIEEIKHNPTFLLVLRKQSYELTYELDAKVKEHLLDFYNASYMLETTQNAQYDYPIFLKTYIERVKEQNKNQGHNGIYFGHSLDVIATIRLILLNSKLNFKPEIIDSIISVVSDTLVISKEDLNTKLDAVSLLIYFVLNNKNDFERNSSKFNLVIDKKEDILDLDNTFSYSNIDKISLKISLELLSIAIGKDEYINLTESMIYIQDNQATIIEVSKIIVEYLEVNESVILPEKVDIVILQNVLQWLQNDFIDIRYNATRILLMLLRNPENRDLINKKIITLIDEDCLYIKKLILQNLYKLKGITKNTKSYVSSQCKNDQCYVVRKTCAEILDRQNENLS